MSRVSVNVVADRLRARAQHEAVAEDPYTRTLLYAAADEIERILADRIGGPTTVVKELETENRRLRAEAERLQTQSDMRMRGWDLAIARAVAAERDLAAARAERDGLAKALAWYGEQSRLARLVHSEGDAGRHALAADGGGRARAALAALPPKEAVVEDDTVPPDAVVMRYGDKSTTITNLAPPQEEADA